MPYHVETNRAQMQAALATDAGRWGNRLGRQVVNAAKVRAPVDEGRLRSSITHTVTVVPGSAVVRVGSPLEYARYVHEGTGVFGPKRQRIRPVSAKALKFPTPKQMGPLRAGARRPSKDKRGFVFADSVAGQPPNPFLTDALVSVMGAGLVTIRRGN